MAEYGTDTSTPDESQSRIQLLDSLASWLESRWHTAEQARRERDPFTYKAMRQINAEYDPDVLADLAQTPTSTLFLPLADLKRVTASAKLKQAFTSGHVPPFAMSATPDPVLPVDVARTVAGRVGLKVRMLIQQTQGRLLMDEVAMANIREAANEDVQIELRREAGARAKRNERTIEDALVDAEYVRALNIAIDDGTSFDGGFVRIVPRIERRIEHSPDGPKVVERLVEHAQAEHPMHIYPQPGIESTQEGYIFVWRQYTRDEMNGFRTVPGVRTDKLDKVLARQGDRSMSGEAEANEAVKEILERKGPDRDSHNDRFIMRNYYGGVRGKDLREWGYEESYGKADFADEEAVEVQAWVCEGEVIKVAINDHPLRMKPIFMWKFRDIPHAFWGKGVLEIVRPMERGFLSQIRNIMNNQAIASGPQVVVNVSSIKNETDPTKMRPWMIWETTNDPYGAQLPPVTFNQPDSRAHELMAVATMFDNYADVMAGIPSYMGGDVDVKGAGRTAGGLHQIRTEAGALLGQSGSNIDAMNRDAILWFYTTWLMSNRIPKDDVGDVRVTVGGTAKLAEMEQNSHNLIGFLQATANEWDIGIIGAEGRRAMLSEVAKSLKVDFDSAVVPSKATSELVSMFGGEAPGQSSAPAPGGNNTAGQAPQSQPAGGPPPGGPQ